MEITGISKSIDVERLTSGGSTLLGIGTRQYVKAIFYVDLNQNRRKVKVKSVYVDVINIYAFHTENSKYGAPGHASVPEKANKKTHPFLEGKSSVCKDKSGTGYGQGHLHLVISNQELFL